MQTSGRRINRRVATWSASLAMLYQRWSMIRYGLTIQVPMSNDCSWPQLSPMMASITGFAIQCGASPWLIAARMIGSRTGFTK